MARVDTVPVGMRQRVEILKALYRGAEILILDEPTAVLTPRETQDLFRAVRNLVNDGKTVIFITHKLREVMEISDRVTVMRDARTVGTVNTPETNEAELARMMVGREVFMQVDKPPVQRGQTVLEARDLTYINETGRTLLHNASFHVYEFEILGIAGVEGNGQTELVEVLTGLRAASAGEAYDRRRAGARRMGRVKSARRTVAHIPEDRLTNGVALTRLDQRQPDRGSLLSPAADPDGPAQSGRDPGQQRRLDQAVRHPGSQRRSAGGVAVRRQHAKGGRWRASCPPSPGC